ncbi:MAG: hypothetical protein M3362_04040 [Acidobacteriota bacterium]|nr:hypothetical protein [Acidobacteriota bacterium]
MTLLPVHITAGVIGLAAGGISLYALKGATVHRRSGMVFVCAMLLMSATGGVMAMVRLNRGNVMGGWLAFYMVTTALLTTRRSVAGVKWLDLAAVLLGLAVAAAGLTWGVTASRSAGGTLDSYPPQLYFIFAAIAMLSVAGDARMMLAGGLKGRRRVVRHLWRMCFAMFMATGSFFLGQAKVFPKPLRVVPLLMIPALLPLALMLYWLARVTFFKRRPLLAYRE